MVINRDKILKYLTGRSVLLAALLVGIFMSCVKIEDTKQGGSGYISFQPLSIDVSVNGEYQTKANVPEEDLPSADDFIITISGNAIDKDIVLEYNEFQEGPILLPVGAYTVSVSYGSNEFDTPYFHKSETVEIKENLTESISWNNVSLANARVMVTLPDMEKHLRDGIVTLSDGTKTITVNAGEYHYVPVKKNVPVTVSLSGTNTLGQLKSFSSSLGVEAKHAYNVVFDLSLPDLTFADQSAGAIAGRLYLTSLASGTELDQLNFDYKISSDDGQTWSAVVPVSVPNAKNECWLISGLDASTTYKIKAVYGGMETEPWEFTPSAPTPITDSKIVHTYENSVLTGSKIIIEGNNVPYHEMLCTLISSRGVKVVKSDGTVVRTLTSAETGEIGKTADWPYLPQGTYTLKPFFVIGEEEVMYSVSSTPTATSFAPDFTVKAYAETSYSRYLDPALKTKANDAGTGDKVMNIQGKVSISDEILGKSYYSDLIYAELTYDDISMLKTDSKVNSSTFRPNTLSGHESLFDATNFDVIGQSWDTHVVEASFVFDGVSVSSESLQCHVTGIPFNVQPPKIKGQNAWTYDSLDAWANTDDYAQIGNGGAETATLSSPKFHVPADIPVTVYTKATANPKKATSGTTFTLYLGSSQLFTVTASDAKYVFPSLQYFSESIEGQVESTVTSQNNFIKCSNSYGLGFTCSYLYYVNVLYR